MSGKRKLKYFIDSSIDDNEVIYLGAKTNFFFIGTKAELMRDLDDIETWCHDYTLNEAVNAERSWEKSIMSGLPQKDRYGDNKKAWHEAAFTAINSLGIAQKRLIDSKRAVKEYTPFVRRTIISTYKKDPASGEEGTAIIIFGSEVGDYWTYKEYKNKKVY